MFGGVEVSLGRWSMEGEHERGEDEVLFKTNRETKVVLTCTFTAARMASAPRCAECRLA